MSFEHGMICPNSIKKIIIIRPIQLNNSKYTTIAQILLSNKK